MSYLIIRCFCCGCSVCGGGCVYDKLTRFGRTDIKDECRCGLNRMIVEKSMEYVLEHLPEFNGSHILTKEDRKMLRNKLTI